MGPSHNILLLLLLLLLGLAAAQRDCAPCNPGAGSIALLVVADVVMTLLIAGGILSGTEGDKGPCGEAPPPELEPTYQELRGARGDIYSSLTQ